MYSGCSYLLDLIASFYSYISLRNFYWIPLLFIFIFIEETNQVRMFYKKTLSIFRSSRSQKFFKIGVLKNFAIFTRKHLCWSLFLIKLQAKRDSSKRRLPVNIAKYLRTPLLKNICERLLLMKRSLLHHK